MSAFDLPTGGRMYLKIAQKLTDQIKSGTFAPGDRLPPERELANTLGVSRSTVREALLALEINRFVEIRVGSGVFVLPESKRDEKRGNLISADLAGPWEILEARRLIEGQAAYCAAQRIDDQTVKDIAKCIDRTADSIDDIPRFERADAEFHALIARAAGNSVIESYVAHLWTLRESSLWESWYFKTRKPEYRRRSVEDHRVIYRALKRRLPEEAKTAMLFHLDVLAERFFELKL